MTPTPTVVVIGEALVDVILDAHGTRRAHPGGSPMNVAVGLARLGVDTSLVTQLGDDPNGRLIVDHLAESGVTLWPGSITTSPTSTSTATLDETGAARYEFDLRWSLPRLPAPDARAIHTGSIGALVEPGAASVRAVFASASRSTLLSFDPNIRPGIMGDHDVVVGRVEELARLSHVVKMSDEDAEWLYPGVAHENIARAFRELGVSVFTVTRGANGCSLHSGGIRLELPAPPVTVVDTVGAGDAFMSGLLFAITTTQALESALAGTISQAELAEIGAVALRSAAITVARAGASPPFAHELA